MGSMKSRLVRAALGALAAVLSLACAGSPARAQAPKDIEKERRWYVYRDADSEENHGVWSGWMPAQATQMAKLDLKDKTDPRSGSTCARVDVKLSFPWWCGIAVSCKEDYWGEKPFEGAYDLSKARKLVFSIKGKQGGESVQIKVAIAGDKPHGDSARIPPATHWITLTKTWQTVELDLKGCNLKRVVTPFCWVTNADYNPGREFTFYLDDIYFVMEEPE
jgi:hypothetical protein